MDDGQEGVANSNQTSKELYPIKKTIFQIFQDAINSTDLEESIGNKKSIMYSHQNT